jgi:hypothetical protein
MRWDRLFDDLESQLDHEQREEERALALETERLRVGRLGLRERLTAMVAAGGEAGAVRVELVGGAVVQVRPAAFGRDWMSGTLGGVAAVGGREGVVQCVVPIGAIAAVLPGRHQLAASLDPQPEAGARLAERIGLAFVLRDLGRRRLGVEVTSLDGRHHGTIDRVARDHLDLALHEPGAPRRERDVQGYRVVPFDRLALVAFR